MRRLIPLVTLAVALACGSESTTSPAPAPLAGTWSLHSVNDSVLPFTIKQTATLKVELLSDVLKATSNGTYSEIFQLRTTNAGQAGSTVSNSNAGTFTLSGTSVALSSLCVSSLCQVENVSGTLSGDTLTLTEPGYVWLFTKQ